MHKETVQSGENNTELCQRRRPQQRQSTRETVTDLQDNEQQEKTPWEIEETAELTAGNEEGGGKCLMEQYTWEQMNNAEQSLRSRLQPQRGKKTIASPREDEKQQNTRGKITAANLITEKGEEEKGLKEHNIRSSQNRPQQQQRREKEAAHTRTIENSRKDQKELQSQRT